MIAGAAEGFAAGIKPSAANHVVDRAAGAVSGAQTGDPTSSGQRRESAAGGLGGRIRPQITMKITIVDIQHKSFKRALQGYDRVDVDQFLDEIIETLEDEAQERAAVEAENADLRERISHFKSMEESLHNTLLLAQRTADEVRASARKEGELIRTEARLGVEKEIAAYTDRAQEARREQQRAFETLAKAKSELRSLLMTHLALLDHVPNLALSAETPSPSIATATRGHEPDDERDKTAGDQTPLLPSSPNSTGTHVEVF